MLSKTQAEMNQRYLDQQQCSNFSLGCGIKQDYQRKLNMFVFFTVLAASTYSF